MLGRYLWRSARPFKSRPLGLYNDLKPTAKAGQASATASCSVSRRLTAIRCVHLQYLGSLVVKTWWSDRLLIWPLILVVEVVAPTSGYYKYKAWAGAGDRACPLPVRPKTCSGTCVNVGIWPKTCIGGGAGSRQRVGLSDTGRTAVAVTTDECSDWTS